MISTVTTTTVTTIVTIASGASLGLLASLLLISVLGTKEITTADTRPRLKAFSKRLNVCILPLLLVFTLIVFFKAFQVIG